ncbi:phage head closure protein [Bacillus sp. JJ722]|uniref:phage head closure protein n=1 Tax=Bacillus sp. JJ722 TaxID=3122973 RepID=UPI0030009C95
MADDFPHEVEIHTKQRIPDGVGGYISDWAKLSDLDAFVDTPTSRERYEAQQLSNPLDRYMYFEYGADLTSVMRIKHNSDLYELAGRPEDQGGADEVMRVALKLVT